MLAVVGCRFTQLTVTMPGLTSARLTGSFGLATAPPGTLPGCSVSPVTITLLSVSGLSRDAVHFLLVLPLSSTLSSISELGKCRLSTKDALWRF